MNLLLTRNRIATTITTLLALAATGCSSSSSTSNGTGASDASTSAGGLDCVAARDKQATPPRRASRSNETFSIASDADRGARQAA